MFFWAFVESCQQESINEKHAKSGKKLKKKSNRFVGKLQTRTPQPDF